MNSTTPTANSVRVFASLGFPQGGADLVETIKNSAALLHDELDRISTNNREAGRMAATAKTHLELAVMCAVKAVSRYTEPKKHTCEHSGAKVDITSVQVEQVTDEVLLRNQARADS